MIHRHRINSIGLMASGKNIGSCELLIPIYTASSIRSLNGIKSRQGVHMNTDNWKMIVQSFNSDDIADGFNGRKAYRR